MRMERDAEKSLLIYKIWLGYEALLKQRQGLEILESEYKILEELEPIDVTGELLLEINRLNREIVKLIFSHYSASELIQ
jgi:hypothetical protein